VASPFFPLFLVALLPDALDAQELSVNAQKYYCFAVFVIVLYPRGVDCE
jgi:hypothetical protein